MADLQPQPDAPAMREVTWDDVRPFFRPEDSAAAELALTRFRLAVAEQQLAEKADERALASSPLIVPCAEELNGHEEPARA